MRIDLAYCVELKKVMDIYTACVEFSSQLDNQKFHFYCSDQKCRESKVDDGGVRVTAVNHQSLPEDCNILKSPHYRKWDAHFAECPWVSIDSFIEEYKKELGEDSAFIRLAKINHKLITRFLLPDLNGCLADDSESELSSIRTSNDSETRKHKIREYIRSTGATATSLESLVSCFEQLLGLGMLNEELSIPGHGATTYKEFFKQIKFAKPQQPSVSYGGATLYKRYGRGFSLTFMDMHDKLPVTLYISHKMITSSRFGLHLARIIDEVESNKDQRPYLKFYWLGGMEKKGATYNATIKSLSHIVMRLVYPQ